VAVIRVGAEVAQLDLFGAQEITMESFANIARTLVACLKGGDCRDPA
jgi:hypothetical protein